MIKKILIAASFIGAVACNNTQSETATEETATEETGPPAAGVKETKPDFSNIQFASVKDTSCGMPLSAGVQDTAMVDGKIYGFCSKECKDEFEKTLQAKK